MGAYTLFWYSVAGNTAYGPAWFFKKDTNVADNRFEIEFEDRLQEALHADVQAIPVRPNLHAATVSCLIMDQDNRPLWMDPKIEGWLETTAIDEAICSQARSTGQVQLSLIKDRHKRPLLLTYAPGPTAENWPLGAPHPSKALESPGVIVVGAISLAYMSDELEFAARALGLSNLEARVAASLFVHGSTKQAADYADVTYNTARKALSAAMRKLKITRKTALVQKLSELAAAVSPPREAVERVLIDIFGLTLREAQLSLLLCEGHTRASAARIQGLSDAVAKDHFAQIFQTLGINSATDIPRLTMEAFAAAMLVREQSPLQGTPGRQKAPLHLIQRKDLSLVAVSDYGPDSGQPVLIVHSSLSTRHPFRKVVLALQAEGFRPITIDRPGFGLSDNMQAEEDPFATGIDDIILVCNTLGINKLDILTRGGAFHVLAFARQYPDRLGRVVVINPDLLQHQCSSRKGHLGLVRKALDRYPDRVEVVTRWACTQLNEKSVSTFIRMGLNKKPVDVRSFEDPDTMDDYSRSILAFASGQLSGLIREQRGYATLEDVEGLAQASNWTIVLGGEDPIHDPKEMLNFWQAKLPNANVVTLPDANRFISLSHTQQIVSLLRGRDI